MRPQAVWNADDAVCRFSICRVSCLNNQTTNRRFTPFEDAPRSKSLHLWWDTTYGYAVLRLLGVCGFAVVGLYGDWFQVIAVQPHNRITVSNRQNRITVQPKRWPFRHKMITFRHTNRNLLPHKPSPLTCGKVAENCGKPYNILWKTRWKLLELSTGGGEGQGSESPVWKTSGVTNEIYRTCQHLRKPWNNCKSHTILSPRNMLCVSTGVCISPCNIQIPSFALWNILSTLSTVYNNHHIVF